MNKYILFYIGPGLTAADTVRPLTYAELQQWEQSIGNSLAGRGMMLGQNGKGVVDTNAVESAPFPMYGFSIIQAETLDDAVALTKSHPLLTKGNDGMYEVQVMQLFTEDVPAEAIPAAPILPPEIQNTLQQPLPPGPRATVSDAPSALPPQQPGLSPQQNPVMPQSLSDVDTGPSLPAPVPGELTVPHDTSDDEQ